MFGLPEIVAEMIQLIDIPEFKDAWLRYCAYCRAPRDVLDDLLGPEYKPPESPGSHAGILAYAAAMKGDPQLAAQVGEGFFSGKERQSQLGNAKKRGSRYAQFYRRGDLGKYQ